MAVLLCVLKIIGIILLIIACVLAAVLFIPVRYSISGDIDSKKGCLKLNWFFRLISFDLSYDNKLSIILRILFFKIDFTDPDRKKKRQKKKRKKRKVKKKKGKNKKDNRPAEVKKTAEKSRDQKKGQQEDLHKGKDTGEKDYNKELDTCEENYNKEQDAGDKNLSKKKGAPDGPSDSELRGKINDALNKIKEGAPKFFNILKNIKAVYDTGLIQRIWPVILVFLRRIKPKKISGEIEFGLDDPSKTGMLLGAAAVIVPLSQEEFHLYPDFDTDKNYVSGQVLAKGNIFIIHVLILIIKLAADKDVRKIFSKVRSR